MLHNIIAVFSLFIGILYTMSITAKLCLVIAQKEGAVDVLHFAVCAAAWTCFISAMWIF